MRQTLYTNKTEYQKYLDGKGFLATYIQDADNKMPFTITASFVDVMGLKEISVRAGNDADFEAKKSVLGIPNETAKPQLIDLGEECVILINGEDFRVDHLSPVQFVDLLNRKGLADIQTVSYTEYAKSK